MCLTIHAYRSGIDTRNNITHPYNMFQYKHSRILIHIVCADDL